MRSLWLTLLVTPVAYSVFDDAVERLWRRRTLGDGAAMEVSSSEASCAGSGAMPPCAPGGA